MSSTHCILIVDDDSHSLEVLAHVLQRDGYETVTASDGATALEAAEQHRIDLALVDFNLPDTTGDQVLHHIRRLHPLAPVLIMSADEKNLFPASDAGAYAFVRKPINLGVLRTAITRALARRYQRVSHQRHGVQIQHTSVWIRWSRRITWWKSVE